MATSLSLKAKRAQRTRTRLKAVANGRPRLSVHRSLKNISVQVIDDVTGVTVAAASSQEADLVKASGTKSELAAAVGKLVAERAIAKGVSKVVFDRGAYLFHGRVKALADAARSAGLEF
jgi:large subunit ribosomal protein L18